jgi:hypothetical protein
LHRDKFQEEPGWLRVKGAIEGKQVVLKFGTPPDTTVIVIDPPKGKTIYVERRQQGRTRLGWLERPEPR